AVATILSTKEPEYSSSMGYENPNTTSETESDEIIKSGVEELVPILSENEVTLEDKREYDMIIYEDSTTSDICDNHSDIFSDSKIEDDISSDDDDFKDIEYVEASLYDPEIASAEEENVVHQEEEEVDLEDISQIQDELAEYENSQSRDHSNSLNNNEEHSVQNKESLENSSNEIDALNSNQEKEEPSQDSNIRQLIREESCVEVSEEQKQNMEDTMLELVKICQQKELLCIHDNVDDLIESALNTKLLSINSQRLDKKRQEVKNVVEQPAERGNHIATILSTKEPEYSSSMGYENPNTTSETESDEIIKSGVEELVPILNENEVTLEDKRECDVPVCEYSPICDDHSDIFSDFKNDDDISTDDDDFEDVEYAEASLSDPEIVGLEEENGEVD
nr:hypothetical protein [Tanacetum cinerariifolium]